MDKLDKAGAVYNISCLDCPSSYVGETARSLRYRLSEHERPTSPVGEHGKQHSIDWEGDRILDREENLVQERSTRGNTDQKNRQRPQQRPGAP